jgi:NAD(P)-dependent dehydrogenase (short-subunit alcohol dehydrogenase family)
MTDLKQKVAIVTGGGSGIGQAIALGLAEQGVKVVVCGRRLAPLESITQTIQDSGGTAWAIQADVADADDVDRLVQASLETFGAINILVNNAGISGGGYIHEHDLNEWDRIMAINLRGPFLLARAVLPLMRQHREGHIINISSEAGLEYYFGDGAYGISKHALNALGEYIQRENQEWGIRVNTICPGMVVTEMTDGLSGLNKAMCLQPEEIADLVLWLLTRQSNLKIGRPVLIQTMTNPWQV